jgi:hypothetical protein
MTSCSTSVCGVGGWNGPLPGDPDNNSVLTATPAFGGIDVAWSYPATNPEAVAYVQLYRGTSSSFSSAILLATVGGNFFYDKSTSAELIEYFYWIKIVSVNGTVGELIGPASAIAKPLIATVIEQLTGQIDAGLLAQSLKTDIDRITLNYAELTGEINNRIAANNALSAALVQVQSGVDQSLAFINEEITSRQEGDSALVTQLNTVAAANQNNLALIQQEQSARVDGDSANASLYTLLNSQVNNPTTGLPATRASLLNDYYTKTSTDSAIASATSTLISTTGLDNALSNYTTTAVLNQNYYTKTATDSAISNATLTLVSTTDLNNSLNNYTLNATLQTDYYTRTATDSAISSAITTSQTTLNDSIASAQTTLQTNINTVNGKVTEIGALYTAKLSVNGLIGGFGVYNDGTTVQAGFDVDEFWVGRTQANKRKPFIISDGVTYIDEAAIEKLTFTKLRDASGSFIVENGKVKADYLTVTNNITVPSVGGNIELGNDVGPGAGHAGLSLSHVDFNNIFIRRSDGVTFFRVNEGGANSISFDSSSGVLAIKGVLSASQIAVGTAGTSTTFFDPNQPTVPLNSNVNGFLAYNGDTGISTYVPQTCTDNKGVTYDCSYTAFAGAPITSTELEFSTGTTGVPITRRIRVGTVRFVVNAAGTVDHFLSIWYRYKQGNGTYSSWLPIAETIEPQSNYGSASLSAVATLGVSLGQSVQFGFAATNAAGNYWNSGLREIRFGTITVTGTNF